MIGKAILAGNNLAALHALDLLLEVLEHDAVMVIAPPPSSSPEWHVSLEEHTRAREVRVLTPQEVNAPTVLDEVVAFEPDLLLSVYYTQLFDTRFLQAAPRHVLNVHPSLLPRHRGTAPIIWAIAEGDRQTGLTIHRVDAGVDTGRIVLQRFLPIHRDDTGYDLHLKMANLVRASVGDLVRRHVVGAQPLPEGLEQIGAATVHTSKDPRLNRISWEWDRERVRNVVRALAPPLPGAYALVNGEPLVIGRVEPADDVHSGSDRAPGMVDLRAGELPVVWAGDGPLRIHTFVDAGALVGGSELASRLGLRQGQVFE
jgi:methionyl-tRNA formyltransferase